MFKDTLEKIRSWYRGLPDKKKYVEFITAVLTVPVLLTVLISNLSNINSNKKNDLTPTPVPTKEVTITEKINQVSITPTITLIPSPSVNPECKKEVGPIRITSPVEGQLVNSNPVCILISYQVGEYCSVIYSYRIDEGDWSDYTDKTICLHNLSVGPKTLELRVKSSQSDDEITLLRNFYYKSKEIPTSAPTSTIAPTPQ